MELLILSNRLLLCIAVKRRCNLLYEIDTLSCLRKKTRDRIRKDLMEDIPYASHFRRNLPVGAVCFSKWMGSPAQQ